jgi:hypothetical protein
LNRSDNVLIGRILAGLSSLTFGVSSLLAAGLGQAHMTRCGAGLEVHCGWCFAAAGLACAAAALLAEAVRPRAAPAG